ncbi:hypothetical protein G3A41_20900 [Paraburkholderia aspalathi]|nr:hypothetical protein [Paraburkholderia aspalathi]MBK3832512.1 hypothetical protein [Paraburkholderia aspalathi]
MFALLFLQVGYLHVSPADSLPRVVRFELRRVEVCAKRFHIQAGAHAGRHRGADHDHAHGDRTHAAAFSRSAYFA